MLSLPITVVLFCLVGILRAETLGPITTSTPISSTPVDFTSGLTFPQFDPNLGILTTVTFLFNATSHLSITSQNTSDISSMGDAQLNVSLSTRVLSNQTLKLSFIDPDSFIYNSLAPSQSLTRTYDKSESYNWYFVGVNNQMIDEYVGTGTFTLPVFTATSFFGWSSQNDTYSYSATEAETGSVTYTYQKIVAGDMNQDGFVSAADVSLMLSALANPSAFESTAHITDGQLHTLGDVNADGMFNNADLQSLLNLLKSGTNSMDPVPEPSTIALLTLGGLGLLARRRFAASM